SPRRHFSFQSLRRMDGGERICETGARDDGLAGRTSERRQQRRRRGRREPGSVRRGAHCGRSQAALARRSAGSGRARSGRQADLRSPQEDVGDLIAPPGYEQEGSQRAGHIPTAASIPWSTAVRDDGTFKSADELRELYEGKGVTPEKEVTAYCRIGERSAHTWFVLRELLGYATVKNYDGSWTEWGNLVDVPIEKGS